MRFAPTFVTAISLAIASNATAQDAQDLAQKLSNPISDLVSVPVQFNWEFGEGPDEDTWEITNVQPVAPIHLSQSTTMIGRLIMPTVSRPGETFDGDMTFSLFFSPRNSKPIWGAGPAMILPRTGEKWDIGPTLVVLQQNGHLTYGALTNSNLVLRRRQGRARREPVARRRDPALPCQRLRLTS